MDYTDLADAALKTGSSPTCARETLSSNSSSPAIRVIYFAAFRCEVNAANQIDEARIGVRGLHFPWRLRVQGMRRFVQIAGRRAADPTEDADAVHHNSNNLGLL